MNSPRYRPAGLLVVWCGHRVMLDGGGSAVPVKSVHAWLVCDLRAELIADIRRQARAAANPPPTVGGCETDQLHIRPLPVVHTSHETFGYLIDAGGRRIVWAPEFLRFPQWAAGADLMFAEGRRPIRFAGQTGGHAAVTDTAEHARQTGVRRLVFAHIGRPSIHARDAGLNPPYGEWGVQGRVYRLAALAAAAHGSPSM